MTFKISPTARDRLRELVAEQAHYWRPPKSSSLTHSVNLYLLSSETDPLLLREVLDRTPAEAIFVTSEGIGLRESWVQQLLQCNGGSDAEKVASSDQPSARPEPLAAFDSPKPSAVAAPAPSQPVAPVTRKGRRNHLDWQLLDPAPIRAMLTIDKDSREIKAERRRLLTELAARSQRQLPRVHRRLFAALDILQSNMPNFTPVIEHFRNHLILLQLTGRPLSLPPTLLVGPPGIGKTYFVESLAEMLGFHLHIRSMAEISAAFVLNGAHRTWGSAQMGAVAKLCMETPDGQAPLLILDEVEKIQRGNYSPEHSLLGLLEPGTARHFRDEYLDVEMDLRPLSVLMTGNEPLKSGSPLASRVTTIWVEMPSAEQMPSIARAVDRQLRQQTAGLQALFAPLSEEIITQIAQCAPREMLALLSRAYARAAREVHGQARNRRQRKVSIRLEHLHPVDPSIESPLATSVRTTPITPLLVIDQRDWAYKH